MNITARSGAYQWWLCHTCLVESDEPYCPICGLDLNHQEEINRPAGLSFEASAQPGQGGNRT